VPFGDLTVKEAIAYVKSGGRVQVTHQARSTHPFEMAMLQAMEMCFVYEPEKRATASQVVQVLQRALVQELD